MARYIEGRALAVLENGFLGLFVVGMAVFGSR
jgi:hypothetical protein